MVQIDNIRRPRVAGVFYPDKDIALEREISLLLESAPNKEINGEIISLISPHAGYMYSGGVAARAYSLLFGREYDLVVVIAPSHREYFTEVSIFDGLAYETPLGSIPVNTEAARLLEALHPNLIISSLGHQVDEHSLEVQLPFLQKVLDSFTLLPIVMGGQGRENIEALANGLAAVLKDRSALIVASTDLSHFYEYDRAVLLDMVVIEDVNTFNEDKLFNDLDKNRCEMCGGGTAIAAMKAARLLGANKSEILSYRNSGDVFGEKSEVVGYLSAVQYKLDNKKRF